MIVYDSVDHALLVEMCSLHRLPSWVGRVIQKLSSSRNTKISVRTARGLETSEVIRFNKGLPKGDALCPRLFTLCVNPVSWLLSASDGYRMTKPIGEKITHLLYIDDIKIYAPSEEKLVRVIRSVKSAMADIGLEWNDRKCSVVHVKRGVLQDSGDGMRLEESEMIEGLSDGSNSTTKS